MKFPTEKSYTPKEIPVFSFKIKYIYPVFIKYIILKLLYLIKGTVSLWNLTLSLLELPICRNKQNANQNLILGIL